MLTTLDPLLHPTSSPDLLSSSSTQQASPPPIPPLLCNLPPPCNASMGDSPNSPLKLAILSLISILLLTLFLLHPNPHHHSRRLLQSEPPPCSPSTATPDSDSSLLDYSYLHSCVFRRNSLYSVPLLSMILVLHFYFLIKTAHSHFSVVVTALAARLRLSPSMGAVTLLALGNGAPDVFSSISAVRSGRPRTGFGAILSAGAFVSAFVVGVVAIHAAPFALDPAPFARDVFFYFVAASGLFYVYLSAEIYLWQAAGFVAFYLFFVAFVVWMDAGSEHGGRKAAAAAEVEVGGKVLDYDDAIGLPIDKGEDKWGWSICGFLEKILKLGDTLVATLLKLTIPAAKHSEWSRFYRSANIAFCPIALLYSCRSFVSFNHPIVFLIPHTLFPLWCIVLLMSCSLALLHYIIEKEPPETEQLPVILVGFTMSVFWISTVAGEMMECLSAIGSILKLPPHLLGLTVLAWGNSVGDLVADVAVAKAGQPAMALAGCFAGPMFNMLVGMGTALVMQTADVYPEAYVLRFNVGIVVAFVFLLLSLMGSLLVVTWFGFRMPRFWGFCLVGLYIAFIILSLVIAEFIG